MKPKVMEETIVVDEGVDLIMDSMPKLMDTIVACRKVIS
jgi:hypothetical protein